MSQRTKLILCAGILVVPLVVVALFLWIFGGQEAEATMADNGAALRQIRATTGLDLPEDTEVLGLDADGALDSGLSAKLAFAPEALEQFLASLALVPADFAETQRYFLGTNQGRWDPETPPALPTTQTALAPGRILNIGIDRRDPQRPVVYLFWHTL